MISNQLHCGCKTVQQKEWEVHESYGKSLTRKFTCSLNVWRIVDVYELSSNPLSSSQQLLNPLSVGLPPSELLCSSHSPLAVHVQCQGRLLELDQIVHHLPLWQKHHNCSHIPKLSREFSHIESIMDYLEDIPFVPEKFSSINTLLDWYSSSIKSRN